MISAICQATPIFVILIFVETQTTQIYFVHLPWNIKCTVCCQIVKTLSLLVLDFIIEDDMKMFNDKIK